MIWIDFTIWACVLALSFIVLGGLLLLVFRVAKPVERQKKNKTGVKPIAAKDSAEEEEEEEEEDTEEEEEQRNGLPRRGGLARLQLRRRGKQKPPSEPSLEDVGAESPSESDTRPTKRVGAKKLAKMQRKEEARQNRQAADERRAQRKAKEEAEEAERQKQKEEEREQEKLMREEEQRRKKERQEKELEEFKAWKGFIEVESEGSAKAELEEKRAKLAHLADHVKNEKVVLLEDLAITFGLQTQEVIDELKKAEDEGRLTGVIDERGKYIYISPEEMEAVARFIKYRGRVSISEIAVESNKLIKMSPEKMSEEGSEK